MTMLSCHTMPSTRVLATATTLLAALALGACGTDTVPSTSPESVSSREGGAGGAPSAGSSAAPTNTVAGRCNGTIGAISTGDVFVPNGASCTLSGTRVRGNIVVAANGALSATGVRVEGSVQAEDARSIELLAGSAIVGDVQVKRRSTVRIVSATVGGNVQIEEAGAALSATDTRVTGNVQVTKAASADLTRLIVNGDVQLSENAGALRADRADVSGNMQVEKNRGGVSLLANRVRQALQCTDNVPAPAGNGNVAGEKTGQCRAL